MLTILFIASMLYQGHAVVNYGTDFITAFPENIAYYYPVSVSNSLKITGLSDNTNVNVTFSGAIIQHITVSFGEIVNVPLPGEVEEYKLGVSPKSVRITSDNNITVFSITQRENSAQTNIVQPISNLGNIYMVPFLNYTELISLMNKYDTLNTNLNYTYNQFRILIINAEAEDNSVMVSVPQSPGRSVFTQFTLGPFELVQMQSPESVLQVNASASVAVLLTHPCMDTTSCNCSMLLQQLLPTRLQQNAFLVPPCYTANYTRLILTSDQTPELRYGSPPLSGGVEILQPGSSMFLPFFPSLVNGSPNITTSQPASLSLIYPGVIMGIIPLSMFSACYLVHITSETSSNILVIAETTQTQYVHLDQNLISETWNILNGTNYSWANVTLFYAMSHTVWHPSSKIAVYFIEKMPSMSSFGGPAISINEEPDSQGCLVIPARLDMGSKPLSWQRSRQYCMNKGGSLANPSSPAIHSTMAQMLTDAEARGQAWIGLRRSLTTMAWYWQSNDVFDFTSWDKNQPHTPDQGLCASMLMGPGSKFSWSSDPCCSPKTPVCFFPARYMYLTNP
ncbi:IgGFc-binding protein-like [Brachyhypopomus gauderio]|uniref:IgGFc-binding protein-like n=1 Tax=Brachyhypopomus gauderio TaxID=698409 RepID=UPI004040EA4B